MLRFRIFFLIAAVVAGFAACAGTATTGSLVTVTGIVVRAESLTVGRGCGPAPSQVFKYAVVVFGHNPDGSRTCVNPADKPADYGVPIAANVYDCFADGTFVQLPVVNSCVDYRLEVRAFNRSAYEQAASALASLQSIAAPAADDAGVTPLVRPAAVDDFQKTVATWTTECTATQLTSVQSLAVCKPLGALGDSIVRLPTEEFVLAEGGLARCAPAGDAGTDAGDGGTADAGAALDFASVRARARTSSTADAGTPRDVPCPTPFEETFPPEPQVVSIDAVLLGASGAEIGRTTCTAETRPGATVLATCDPVR